MMFGTGTKKMHVHISFLGRSAVQSLMRLSSALSFYPLRFQNTRRNDSAVVIIKGLHFAIVAAEKLKRHVHGFFCVPVRSRNLRE